MLRALVPYTRVSCSQPNHLPKPSPTYTIILGVRFQRELEGRGQSILKQISPDYSLKEQMLKLKLQYFGHLVQTADCLFGKDPDAGKD